MERYAATGDGIYAAEKAGYASPKQRASQNLAKPAIQVAVARDVGRRLDRMTPKLLGRLEDIIDDPASPAKQLIDISKTLLPFWKANQTGADAKELHEMSAAELHADIVARKARIAELETEANTIEHEPAAPAQSVAGAAQEDIFG